MFKGKVSLYKNVGGKEERIEKEFDNEKEFDAFVSKHPDFKALRDWKPVRWPEFDGLQAFFEEADRL
jgi:hypothetical protein